jgi:putative Mg2+ transporter-C (MgtC) family protein
MRAVLATSLWDAVWGEFADVLAGGELATVVLRLCVAAALGGLLGYQRASWGKAAGLRTHMLVALGAAFFVAAPALNGMSQADLSRVIQGITTGIGFLGAGTILKLTDTHRVKGLTTAAGIWLTAAVGVSAGLGRLGVAAVGAVLAYLILGAVGRLEKRAGLDPGEEIQ